MEVYFKVSFLFRDSVWSNLELDERDLGVFVLSGNNWEGD